MPHTSFDSLDIKDTFALGGPFSEAVYVKVCRRNDDGSNISTTFHRFTYQYHTHTFEAVEAAAQDYELKQGHMNYVTFCTNCTAIQRIKIIVQRVKFELTF